ncbi:hypothetical protein C8Q74DRAFT_1172145, partial [Fomes fomentarius]
IFLPPYSPDLNPIEEAFSACRSCPLWKLHHADMYVNSPSPEVDLMEACLAAVSAEKVLSWYRHSGYI